MAKIDDLLDDVPDPRLRSELRQAVNELRSARTFGLVFEDHIPEEVALPGLPVRRGSTVQNRTRPDDITKYEVIEVDGDEAQVRPVGNGDETSTVPVRDLMVVRRFGEPIYPGLTQVGEVRRGPDDKPAHAVINAENFHALQMLTYAHAGKVDVIYIDPPYNTGARDWKYNNRFVDANDQWRHSKWLSMMEKRLNLAKRLLRPDDSTLIVTIDEKEYLHLGMLLQQVFPGVPMQMISAVINPKGTARTSYFSRTDEYIYVLFIGASAVPNTQSDEGPQEVRWRYLRRTDIESRRGTVKGGRAQFYPIYVDTATDRIVKIGDPIPPDRDRASAPEVPGCVAVFPIREQDGTEMNWGLTGPSLQNALDNGYVRVTRGSSDLQPYIFSYLTAPNIARVERGELERIGKRDDGSWIVVIPGGKASRPTTTWRERSHDAGAYGTSLLRALIPGHRFPFPKSLYSVEDTLELFVRDKPEAIVLDFFAGSGTTTHAVMRLNHRDGGRRTSLLVTNNEVSAEEQSHLREAGLHPGDRDWEKLGIFEHVTVPRISAAVTGRTPDGSPVRGAYKFTDEFPIADGLEENAVFFRLDYLDPDVVSVGRQYSAIAPLLWLAAGSIGRWADRDGDEPWSVPESSNYAVLFDEDRFAEFKTMIEDSERIGHVWLVTNSSQSFAEMRSQLPDRLEVQMLYRDYLSNFRVNTAETFS